MFVSCISNLRRQKFALLPERQVKCRSSPHMSDSEKRRGRMTKVWRSGLMTLRGYWVSFDHGGKSSDGEFDILKGKGLQFCILITCI